MNADRKTWPNPQDKCYDCGSTIPGHHTPLCDFSSEGDILDLPQVPETQWWTKELPPKKGEPA